MMLVFQGCTIFIIPYILHMSIGLDFLVNPWGEFIHGLLAIHTPELKKKWQFGRIPLQSLQIHPWEDESKTINLWDEKSLRPKFLDL